MNKRTTCEITLFPNGAVPGVYYSGRSMSGTVLLTLYQPNTVRDGKPTALFVHIRGTGQSEWSVKHGNDKLIQIESGIYSFAFQCDLPDDLPTSCEEKYGHIRYLATVHFERPQIPDKTFSVPFTVIKPHNLNADPIFQLPSIKQETINFFRFLIIKPNYLILTATTETKGYAPGQTIEIQLDVDNRSKQNIHEFKIGFYKVMEHYDNGGKKCKKHKKLMAGVDVDGCAANATASYRPEIEIPPAPPTDTTASAILKITYEIKIKGKVDRGRSEPRIKLPITIGTIPLFSTYRRVHFEDSSNYNYTRAPSYETYKEEHSEIPDYSYHPLYPVFHLRNRKKSQRTSESSNP